MSEEALETFYANCTVAEAAGQDSLDEWISNTLKTCQLRPEDIEITETKCEGKVVCDYHAETDMLVLLISFCPALSEHTGFFKRYT